MSRYYTEETIMEIGKVALNVTRYPNTDDVLELCWVEDMPPPHTDNNVEIELDKDKAIELIKALKNHFGIYDMYLTNTDPQGDESGGVIFHGDVF